MSLNCQPGDLAMFVRIIPDEPKFFPMLGWVFELTDLWGAKNGFPMWNIKPVQFPQHLISLTPQRDIIEQIADYCLRPLHATDCIDETLFPGYLSEDYIAARELERILLNKQRPTLGLPLAGWEIEHRKTIKRRE